MMNMMDRFAEGRGHQREIDMLLELTKQIEGRTICALGDAAATTLLSGLSRYFPVTVLDCPTGPGSPDTAAALARSHAAVFVLPATPAGVDAAGPAQRGQL